MANDSYCLKGTTFSYLTGSPSTYLTFVHLILYQEGTSYLSSSNKIVNVYLQQFQCSDTKSIPCISLQTLNYYYYHGGSRHTNIPVKFVRCFITFVLCTWYARHLWRDSHSSLQLTLTRTY